MNYIFSGQTQLKELSSFIKKIALCSCLNFDYFHAKHKQFYYAFYVGLDSELQNSNTCLKNEIDILGNCSVQTFAKLTKTDAVHS